MVATGMAVGLVATWNVGADGPGPGDGGGETTFLRNTFDFPVEPEISTGKLLRLLKEGKPEELGEGMEPENAVVNLSAFKTENVPGKPPADKVTEFAPSLLAVGQVEFCPGALKNAKEEPKIF